MSFFAIDRYWPQLKLVTLVHAAAHFDDINHHVLGNHYDNDILYGKMESVQLDHGTSVLISDLARTDLMFLVSISRLCRFGECAGFMAC